MAPSSGLGAIGVGLLGFLALLGSPAAALGAPPGVGTRVVAAPATPDPAASPSPSPAVCAPLVCRSAAPEPSSSPTTDGTADVATPSPTTAPHPRRHRRRRPSGCSGSVSACPTPGPTRSTDATSEPTPTPQTTASPTAGPSASTQPFGLVPTATDVPSPVATAVVQLRTRAELHHLDPQRLLAEAVVAALLLGAAGGAGLYLTRERR